MKPLSNPDFSCITLQEIEAAMRLCEVGKGDQLIEAFEADFSALVKIKHSIAISSASAGLHLALLALGVEKEDEIICPTFTFAASAFPICYQYAKPLFVDSEKETWNVSAEYIEAAILKGIKKGKKPKAIILVHSYGISAQINEILILASKYDIPIIEDAASALGTTYYSKQVGTFGTIGVFSFNRNKIISGAGGGCIITQSDDLASKVKFLANQAKSLMPYYHHESIGYNYSLSPLLAEVIRLQLPYLDQRVRERRKKFNEYLTVIEASGIYQKDLDGTFNNRWISTFIFESIESLDLDSLNARKVWKPLHTQPVFKGYEYFGNKESEFLFANGWCLPF